VTALYSLARRGRYPGWRSILFVPANVPRFAAKAPGVGADAVQVDLEDSVPESEKDQARRVVAAVAAQVRSAGADVIVRINRPISQAVRDVEAAVGPAVDAITVTKVDGPSHIRLIDELISECELRAGLELGHTKINAVVETAQAFAALDEIAAASPRIGSMMLGSEDFALELGAEPDDEVLLGPKQRMIIAARAAGLAPLGYIGTIAGFADPQAFRRMVRRSRRFGFEGGTCIHPSQVAILNDEFGVKAEEVEFARKVMVGNAEALAAGRGSFQIDGRMIDAPIVERARRVLEKADRKPA